MSADESDRDAKGRPKALSMSIQGGLLESLGVNMYTSIAKGLVEFVANSYDSDAEKVTIIIPYKKIQKAKNKIKSKKILKSEIFNQVLPGSLEIIVKDDGDGMSPEEIQEKFLPINRNRRKDTEGRETKTLSQSGRNITGRKGLGKLAGFGIANKITIETTKENESSKTTFCLDYNELTKAGDITQKSIVPQYKDDVDLKEKGTKITLSDIKYGSSKSSIEMIEKTIARNFFGINYKDKNDAGQNKNDARQKKFSVCLKESDTHEINNNILEEKEIPYEHYYPNDDGSLEKSFVDIKGFGSIKFEYIVKFRYRNGDYFPYPEIKKEDKEKIIGSLHTEHRGARIYCNSRLAMGPSLLKLKTGVQNYLAHSYMECIVKADVLDREFSDLINTNRTELKENEVTEEFFKKITEIMQKALAENGRRRALKAKRLMQESPEGKIFADMLEHVPAKQQKSALHILESVVTDFGVESQEFKEMAPLLVDCVNTGSVLVKLSELKADPRNIKNIAYHLDELRKIEIQDILKVARGKRDAINALEKLHVRGYKEKGKELFEDDLHLLLSENPWLIKSEFTNFLTSNQSEATLIRRLEHIMKINKDAKIEKSKSLSERPDLVFLLSDSAMPHFINIVELKSPNKPLTYKDLTQLERYILDVQRHTREPNEKVFSITGHLIGQKPPAATKTDDQARLLQEMGRVGPQAQWEVIDLMDLINRAKRSYGDLIASLSKHEKYLNKN